MVARQTDVLPAERRQVPVLPLVQAQITPLERANRTLQAHHVPEHDDHRDQVQATGAMMLLAASPYSLDDLDAILHEEVYPACSFNLRQVAGEWAGFDADWLERRILCGGPPPRPWWRRLGRYLTLGWSVPVRLPEEWREWREDVARLRQEAPAASSPDPAG